MAILSRGCTHYWTDSLLAYLKIKVLFTPKVWLLSKVFVDHSKFASELHQSQLGIELIIAAVLNAFVGH